jgi:hypothetical protein
MARPHNLEVVWREGGGCGRRPPPVRQEGPLRSILAKQLPKDKFVHVSLMSPLAHQQQEHAACTSRSRTQQTHTLVAVFPCSTGLEFGSDSHERTISAPIIGSG